jgi:hypothetical protein
VAAVTGGRIVPWRYVVLLTAAALAAPRASAQLPEWQTVEQSATWYAGFADHALTDRVQLWFDGQVRRMELASEPQAMIIRPGLHYTLTPGVRVGAGYAYVTGEPYGRIPAATPTREHRTWQQALVTHVAGGVQFIHRYRWEQRWVAPVIEDVTGDANYQLRARYLLRVQRTVPQWRIAERPVLLFASDELFLPVGDGDPPVRLTQNRLNLGVGIPIDARQRIELGYLHFWNVHGAARVNEITHTATLSWVWILAR